MEELWLSEEVNEKISERNAGKRRLLEKMQGNLMGRQKLWCLREKVKTKLQQFGKKVGGCQDSERVGENFKGQS